MNRKNLLISGFADEIDPSLNRQLEALQKMGIRYIEMRGVDGKSLVHCTDSELSVIHRKLDAEIHRHQKRNLFQGDTVHLLENQKQQGGQVVHNGLGDISQITGILGMTPLFGGVFPLGVHRRFLLFLFKH